MTEVWIVNYRYDNTSELHVFTNEKSALKNAFDIIREEVDGIMGADEGIINRPRWEPLLNAIAKQDHAIAVYEWGQITEDNEVTVECCEIRE